MARGTVTATPVWCRALVMWLIGTLQRLLFLCPASDVCVGVVPGFSSTDVQYTIAAQLEYILQEKRTTTTPHNSHRLDVPGLGNTSSLPSNIAPMFTPAFFF